PYYATTAWFHEKLSPELQNKGIAELQSEVEKFTLEEVLPAVSYGGKIDNSRKQKVAQQIARYSGLSEEFVLNYNLTVPTSAFWKELLRDEGYTIGRLDSRYRGIDKTNAGVRPDYSPEQSTWDHAFGPAANHYFREVLGFKTDLKYYVSGPVRPWDRSNSNVGERLRQAMSENPALNVFLQQGYYDGACDTFTAKYALWNMDPAGKLQDRIRMEAYQSGHMMYLRAEDREGANDDLREFIQNSIPEQGRPIKYK